MPTCKQWIPTKLFFLSFSGLGMRLRLLKYPRSIILCFAIMHPIITTKTTLEQVLKSIVVNRGAYSSSLFCTLKHLWLSVHEQRLCVVVILQYFACENHYALQFYLCNCVVCCADHLSSGYCFQVLGLKSTYATFSQTGTSPWNAVMHWHSHP